MERRFDWILSGKESGPDPICDVDVWGGAQVGVTPSLGALVPGWLLVVPRRAALSMGALQPRYRRTVLKAARDVATWLKGMASHVYLLEHGAHEAGGDIGCGIDQAHVHVVPGSFDLFKCLSDTNVAWVETSSDDPWAGCNPQQDYYLMGRAGVFYLGIPAIRTSQYYRRWIAAEIGRPDAWNYREWPCYENAYRTLEYLRKFPVSHRRAA